MHNNFVVKNVFVWSVENDILYHGYGKWLRCIKKREWKR